MATDLGQLEFTLTLNDSGFKGQLSQATTSVKESSVGMTGALNETAASSENLKGKFSGMAGQFVIGQAMFAIGQKALSGLNDAVKEGVKNYEDWQQNQAQLNNIIKNTGGAAGQTTESLNKYADALSSQTGITGNAINQAQLMLLQFKGIGKDIFPQTTQAVTDLATAMAHGAVPSQDQMVAAAKRLGIALEDPATGMTRLKLAGVDLSPAQKDVIKQMEAVGNTAGAQKQLLSDVSDIVGGKAVTASHTLAGEQAKLRAEFEQITIVIGQKLTEVLKVLMPILAKVIDWLMAHKVVLAAVAGLITALAIGIGVGLVMALWEAITAMGVFAVVSTLAFWEIALAAAVIGVIAYEIATHWNTLKKWFDEFMKWFKKNWTDLLLVFGPIGLIAKEIIDHWKEVKRVFDDVMSFIKTAAVDTWHVIENVLRPVYEFYKFVFETFYAIAMWVWHGIYNDIIKPQIDLIVGLMHYLWNITKEVFMSIYNDVIKPVFDWIAGVASGVWNYIASVFIYQWNVIKGVWNGVVGWFSGVFGGISNAASGVGSSIVGIFTGIWGTIKNAVKSGVNDVIDILNQMIRGYNDTVGKIPKAPHISPLPHFATGVQNFVGGLALVGERGPELVNLPSGSSVYPNNQTNSMLKGSTTYNIAKVELNTADAVNAFFGIGNRNGQLQAMGISPLAGTTRI